MAVFNPGVMDKRLVIQSKTDTPDGMSGFTSTWGTFATVWGSLWPVSAKEVVTNMALTGQVTHRSRIWYLAGVTSAMRITHGGRTFNILSVINPDESNTMIDFILMEVV